MTGVVDSVSSKMKPHALSFCTLWHEWMTQFLFRLFLWYEFLQSGLDKLPAGNKSVFFVELIDHMADGDTSILKRFLENNWFSKVSTHFPPLIRMLPDDFNWLVVLFVELIFSWLLLFGLATRWSAFLLLVLSTAAWYSVHAHFGYNVCANGWKMPLIYIVMLVAIIAQGPSKLSLDCFIRYWFSSGKK
jgi:putative oxidoreductase